MIFRRLAVYTWAVKRSRWACFALENKNLLLQIVIKTAAFSVALCSSWNTASLSFESWWLLLFSKIISFVPFLSVTLFKVINTLWQKLFLREVFKPSWGSAELYIFKNSLSSNSAASPLVPVSYMFSYAQEGWRGQSCPQSMPHFMYWGLWAFCYTLICF